MPVNFDDYPVTVTLHFRSGQEKDRFFGGLSDGFGESYCTLIWPWEDAPRLPSGAVAGFNKQTRFAVEVFEDE